MVSNNKQNAAGHLVKLIAKALRGSMLGALATASGNRRPAEGELIKR
jgi:hypothetical protein